MDICFISPKSYPLFNSSVKKTFGGAEVQISLLAKELAKNKDLFVHVMVADYDQKDKEVREGVTLWKSLDFRKNIFLQMTSFVRSFKKINAEVYVQRTLTPVSWLIALYCKLKRKKFVYMVAIDGETDGTHRAYDNLFGKLIFKKVFSLSDVVITQNEYQHSRVKSSLLRSAYPIPKRKPSIRRKKTVLWVGRSDKIKQPGIFLSLAEKFPKIPFVMICSKATNDEEIFEKTQKRANSLPNVTFYDFMPFNKVDSFFREAKILVNTSVQEGFPNTFVQAAKNGTPIVSLNVNPNSIFDNYDLGYFCNGRLEELVGSISLLLNSKELFSKKGKQAYIYARKNHDVEVIIKQFLRLIE